MEKDDFKKLKADEEETKEYLKTQQYLFEQKLKGSMGKEMKEWLESPPKPIEHKENFWDKLKKIIMK